MAHGQHANDAHSEHHIIPFGVYMKVFSALIALTVITVLAARVDFGAFGAAVAFGIATVKAVLVLAYFMHLKYDNMLNRVIIASGVFFLIVFYFFCIVDEITRIVEKNTL